MRGRRRVEVDGLEVGADVVVVENLRVPDDAPSTGMVLGLRDGTADGATRGVPRRRDTRVYECSCLVPSGNVDGVWSRTRVYAPTVRREISWREPASYRAVGGALFPRLPAAGLEDPFVYRDRRGRFHAPSM